MDLNARAHLPAVRFSPRAYMGCGGWDLARAPETTDELRGIPRRRSLGQPPPLPTPPCDAIAYEEVEEVELGRRIPRVTMACGSGGYTPEFMKDRDEDELGRRTPRVTMGCGDEMCAECKAKQGLGCPKCKRVRQRAMMNQQDEELRGRIGQESPPATNPSMGALAVAGLAIAGLFYLVTR